jgi:hypothetical protein
VFTEDPANLGNEEYRTRVCRETFALLDRQYEESVSRMEKRVAKDKERKQVHPLVDPLSETEHKEHQEHTEETGQLSHASKEVAEAKDEREAKEVKEAKETKEVQDTTDFKESEKVQESKGEPHDVEMLPLKEYVQRLPGSHFDPLGQLSDATESKRESGDRAHRAAVEEDLWALHTPIEFGVCLKPYAQVLLISHDLFGKPFKEPIFVILNFYSSVEARAAGGKEWSEKKTWKWADAYDMEVEVWKSLHVTPQDLRLTSRVYPKSCQELEECYNAKQSLTRELLQMSSESSQSSESSDHKTVSPPSDPLPISTVIPVPASPLCQALSVGSPLASSLAISSASELPTAESCHDPLIASPFPPSPPSPSPPSPSPPSHPLVSAPSVAHDSVPSALLGTCGTRIPSPFVLNCWLSREAKNHSLSQTAGRIISAGTWAW